MPTVIKPEVSDFKTDPGTLKAFALKTLMPRLGQACGSKQLVFDMRQLDPGMYSFPYHFHRNAEELMMVISGSFTLRSPAGLKIINQGELVFMEMGESGAHQFYNQGNVPCIYLDIRTTTGIDVVEYPDSGKMNILPYRLIFEKESQVDYNKGEENVHEIWEKLKPE
jgi:uncharacterized cupin superfamily protein